MTKRHYVVIGLGIFGTSIAKRLFEDGHDVMGIDINIEKVEDAEKFLTFAAVSNSTVEQELINLEVGHVDCAVVAIGEDMQSSILTVMILKELGVPYVIAKAIDRQHGQILNKIGANWVIYPERDMGERVANQLLSPKTIGYIELTKEDNIEEILIPTTVVGKSIEELNTSTEFNVRIVAIVRNDKTIVAPSPTEFLQKQDILVTIGNKNELAKFSSIK